VYILNLDNSNLKIDFSQLNGTTITSSTELVYSNSDSTNSISFDSTDHNLITDSIALNGVYYFSIRAYLDAFPLMEEFHVITTAFTLTITDICTSEVITSPSITDMLFTLNLSPSILE
jgi:hypothetical protein